MKLITTAQLRKSEIKTKLDEDTLIVCSMGTTLELPEDDQSRSVDFTISSETEDSYRDIVKADGWDLARYLKNPVVLWAHQSRELPLGSASNVRTDGATLKATATFAARDTYDFADDVFKMLKAGFLRATSVGFIPQEWSWDEKRGGYNFIKSELFEFSVVPVPANPDALMNSIAAGGEDTEVLRQWCEKTLDLWRPEGHQALWVPKEKIEEIHKIASGNATVVSFSDPTTTSWETTTTTKDEGTALHGSDYAEFWHPLEFAPIADPADGIPIHTSGFAHVTYGEPDPAMVKAVADLAAIVEKIEKQIEAIYDRLEHRAPAEDGGRKQELSIVLDEDEDAEELESALKGILDVIRADAEPTGEGIDPEVLREAVKGIAETAIMNRTGKLPKEV